MKGNVRVLIGGRAVESPSPTTGAALYALAGAGSGQTVFRQTDLDDVPIENGPRAIELDGDEVFHIGEFRRARIIVEGTAHIWLKPSITHEEVVTLFDPSFPQHPEFIYSVTYDHGPSQNPEGILSPGGSVLVKTRMVFHVSKTGES